MDKSPVLEELYALIRKIPRGCCATYGDLGRALTNPASGYFVGKWIASLPEDIPWWRVVAKGGRIAIAKRDPNLAAEQRKRLEQEGVPFNGEDVAMDQCQYVPMP